MSTDFEDALDESEARHKREFNSSVESAIYQQSYSKFIDKFQRENKETSEYSRQSDYVPYFAPLNPDLIIKSSISQLCTESEETET